MRKANDGIRWREKEPQLEESFQIKDKSEPEQIRNHKSEKELPEMESKF